MAQEIHTEFSSLGTLKIMTRNLKEIVRSWIRLLDPFLCKTGGKRKIYKGQMRHVDYTVLYSCSASSEPVSSFFVGKFFLTMACYRSSSTLGVKTTMPGTRVSINYPMQRRCWLSFHPFIYLCHGVTLIHHLSSLFFFKPSLYNCWGELGGGGGGGPNCFFFGGY